MKNTKTFKYFACTLCILILFTGCSTFNTKETATDEEKETFVQPTQNLQECINVEEAGNKMIDSVVSGVRTKNYFLYSRDFTDKNKKYFNKKTFDKAEAAVKEELGNYKSRKFVGFWVKGAYDILLWKARFSKTKDDVLIQMYVKKVDDTYKIAALKLL